MSIKIMSQVWEIGPPDQGGLLVMLALADWCSDAGECWPSMAAIALKARLADERSARRIVRRLEADGWIEVDRQGGRHGCNKYTLKLGPKVPRTQSTPDPECKKPGPKVPKTRTLEPPEPSVTIIKPSLDTRDEVSEALQAWASPQAVASFIAYRRRHKSKAITLTGARRLAGHLKEIFNAGHDPDDALGMAEEKGWASIEPDWYFKAKGQPRSNGSSPHDAMARAFITVARRASEHG